MQQNDFLLPSIQTVYYGNENLPRPKKRGTIYLQNFLSRIFSKVESKEESSLILLKNLSSQENLYTILAGFVKLTCVV